MCNYGLEEPSISDPRLQSSLTNEWHIEYGTPINMGPEFLWSSLTGLEKGGQEFGLVPS